MKKILVILLFSGLSSNAQTFWTETVPFADHPGYYANSISIVDEAIVWVDGVNNEDNIQKWARSLDGGITWTNGNINLGSAYRIVNNIHAVSATAAYVSCYPNIVDIHGGVWATFDSGANWTQQQPEMYSAANAFPEFVHFWNQTDGLVVGDPTSGYFEIHTTSDGGSNWLRVPQSNIPQPNPSEYVASYDAVGDSIWFITNQHRLFKSENRGLTWVCAAAIGVDMDTVYTFNFSFKNPLEGIMISALPNGVPAELYTCNDGGFIWNPVFPPETYRSKIVAIPQTAGAYFSFDRDINNGLLGSCLSANDGLNWTNINDIDQTPIAPRNAKFVNAEQGYCSGYYLSEAADPTMRFFRLNTSLLKNGAFEKETQLFAAPNPTNDVVKFSGKSVQAIVVFDSLGKIILQQRFNVMEDSVVNLSAFQNGVYLAKITAMNGTTLTVKIVKN